jgi:hypothetical protein
MSFNIEEYKRYSKSKAGLKEFKELLKESLRTGQIKRFDGSFDPLTPIVAERFRRKVAELERNEDLNNAIDILKKVYR